MRARTVAYGFNTSLIVEDRPERRGHAFTQELEGLENIALASAILADQEQRILEVDARPENAAKSL